MTDKSSTVAMRASLFYGLVAGLWILFSDRLLIQLIPDKERLIQLETYKGWAFVAFTGLMLFLIMRQLLHREAQKIAELKKAEALTRLQNEVLEMIAGGKPLKETLEVLLHGIEAQSPEMLVSILLLDADGVRLRNGGAPSLPKAYVEAIDGAAIGPKVGSCGTAAFRGSPVFVGDIAHDPLWQDYKHLALPHKLRACWSTPILDEQKKVLGTFAIYHRVTGMPKDEDVRLIELVTHTAATAIVKDRVEKTLRGSEERFRTLVQQASDAIFVHDTEGRLLDVNQSACESLGYSRKELLRMTVMDIEQGLSLAEVRKIWTNLHLGHSQIIRGRHWRKDGTSFPAEISLTCYEIQGQLVLAAQARNISERKEYEDQLAQSISLLRATIESSVSGLLVVDSTGKITTYNNRFLEMWRIPAEIMAQGDDQVVLKVVLDQLKEPEVFFQRIKELYQQPSNESYDTIEFKDGRIYDRVSRPQRLGDKIIGRVWSFRDVTEHQRAQDAMKHERQLLRTLIDLAPDFIFVKDTESRYLVVNDSLAKCYRKMPAEMLNHTDADFLPAELATHFRASEQQVLASESFCTFEDSVAFPDGQMRRVVTNMVAFRDPQGKISGLVGIGRDITKQQSTEESIRLQSVALETAANAILITDAGGSIEWVNPAFTRSTGYTLAESLGKNPRELIRSGKQNPEFFRNLWQTILAGEVWQGELINRRKNGELYPEEMTITPLLDANKKVTHFVAIKQDISERKTMEQSLLKTQAMYSSLVEQMPVCVFRKDAAGRYEFANGHFCELKGLKREEILGRTPQEVADFISRQTEAGAHQKSVERVYAVEGEHHHETIMKDGKIIEVDRGFIGRDGQLRYFHVVKSPLFDNHHRLIGSQGVMFDITERRRTDEQLRQANDRTQFYMNRMPLAFIAFDRNFCVAEWNHAAEEIFGWSTAEATGQHAYKLIVPLEVQPAVDRVWDQVIKTGDVANHSVNENITKDGRRITCEWRNTPWRNAAGEICGCLSIVTDITDKIRAEKERINLEAQLRQSQKMEAVGQLSGGIAHDFNNILTVIQGNASLLQGLDLQPSEIRDCSNQIARASERAAGLTRQLLMFARKQQMQPVNLDLNETVSQMTKMLQRILGEDIALRSEYSPALPLINADVGMIEQIILNLAVNARDAMPNGGQLTIRSQVEKFQPTANAENKPAEARVCLSVTDTGCGIAPEILARIFEPFFTTKEVGKGTGLGLATVYGIVQQHHGDIVVQSEPGKGTTFRVYFPIAAPPTEVKTDFQKRPVLPWGYETILLVEDEFPLRTFVSDLLQRCGYTVLEAESGPAALKIWRTHHDRIQLVLTDIIMPENMSGIELGRQLKTEKPELKVIYTSGYTGNVEGRQALLTEGVNFIRKPFKPEAIAEIIRNKLDGNMKK